MAKKKSAKKFSSSKKKIIRKKQNWEDGSLFVIQLVDGSYSIGQVLDLLMPNFIRCVFFGIRFKEFPDRVEEKDLRGHEISNITVSREQLDYWEWKVLDIIPPLIQKKDRSNEKLRTKNWVGAVMYDAALAEDFLNAYYALSPWDDWFDPNFLDEFLISSDKKPLNLIYTKTKS